MPRTLLLLLLLGLGAGCASAASDSPPSPAAPPGTPTQAAALATPQTLSTNAPIAATPTPVRTTPTPVRTTPTPHATATSTPAGMTSQADGQTLVLSNAVFYWRMSLPRDWLTTANNGFELDAAQPGKLAFVHLLAQTWLTKDRKPNAAAYVAYWKQSKYGDLFPIFAQGALTAQSEISKDKFGGPYLRYDFVDSRRGLHYTQVYASGGGPSSIVATVWAKSADYAGQQLALDAIINSVELLKEP